MVYQDSARCPDHGIISGGRGSAAPFHEERFGRGTQRGRRVVSRDCSNRIPGPIGPSRDERCPWGPGATGSAGPCGRPRKSRLRGAGLLGPARERARGSRLGRPEPRWPRERQRLDGLGLIGYLTSTNDLKVAHCTNVACTAATFTIFDAGLVGGFISVAIGADGLGLISYLDGVGGDLKVAHCSNVACTAATLTALDTPGNVGDYTSVTIGMDGLGLISYHD